MQMTGISSAVAPLATGHPLGLPASPPSSAVETKVQPIAQQAQTGTDPDPGGEPPSSFWRGLTGLPDPAKHVAPPSIMQIRIAALLQEQAEQLVSLAPDAPEPESAPASTPASDDGAAQAYTGPERSRQEPVFPSAA